MLAIHDENIRFMTMRYQPRDDKILLMQDQDVGHMILKDWSYKSIFL